MWDEKKKVKDGKEKEKNNTIYACIIDWRNIVYLNLFSFSTEPSERLQRLFTNKPYCMIYFSDIHIELNLLINKDTRIIK